MADFDLSLVLRAVDQGATATANKLDAVLAKLSTTQTQGAGSADKAAAANSRAAIAADKEAAAASRAAAAEAQAAAAKDRAAIAALRLEQATARSTAQTLKNDAATRRLGQGLGAARSNMSGFGAQFADVSQTLALGINPFTVLLQQGNQVATSLSGVKGAMGRVATFAAGPLGSAIIAVTGIIGLLAFSGKDAAKAQKELGDGMDIAKLSAKDLTKAIDELEAAERKSIRTSFETEQAKRNEAVAFLAAARAKREEAKATLELAIAQLRGSPQGFGEGSTSIRTANAVAVRNARADLAEITASIGTAESLEKLATAPLLARDIAGATDEAAAATNRFDKAMFTLNKRFFEFGTISEAAYKKQAIALKNTLEAEKRAIQDRNKEANATPRLAPITGREVAGILGTTINPGGGVRSVAKNKAVGGDPNSDHLANPNTSAIDIPLTVGGRPLSKAGIRAALEAAGVTVKQILGPGDKDHEDHFHVAFGRARKGASDVADAAERARETAERAAEALARFGDNAADSITRISAQFDKQPRLIDRVASSTDDLNDLIKELGDRKPLNFKDLIADAERAKTVVANGINRPYEDFIASQQEALQIQQLITGGRLDEADALRITLDLEREMGALTPARREAVLATVQALRAEANATDVLREKQAKYLTALGEIKGAIRATIADPLEGLKDLPGRLVNAFATLKGDELFEKLFGDTFRQIEDKVTGANVAKDAADKMAQAVDKAAASIVKLGNAAEVAATGVDPLAPLPDSAAPDAPGAAGAAGFPGGNDATVTGGSRRTPESFFAGSIEKLARGVGIGKSQAKRDIEVAEALKKGVQIKDDTAAKLGKFAGKAAGGAATGAVVQSFLKPLGKALGVKTSAIGAQIGGAAGAFLPIPFGKEIGAVVGSVIGGLFKKTKSGSSTITNAFDDPVSKGNFQGQTSKLAETIQGSILQIAEQLGGGLGSFNVSVGKRKDKFVVDPTGTGRLKTGVSKFDTEEDAIRFAIIDAVRDGAVTGLSDAVRRALGSSDDIERSLREALKVQELEVLIGGLGSRLTAEFRRFDAMAAERVRLAKKYGLDVLAVEKINAEERLKLVENIITSRVGALVEFKKSIAFGDLFEGDAPTRRSAILGEIDKVQKQAEAGVDGAADKLADLYRTLISTSKEAFGTAGPELAADRARAVTGVDRVIELEQNRIAEARAYNDKVLAAANQNNVLTNETNDLLARLIAQGAAIGAVGGGAPGGGGGVEGSVARVSNISVRNL